MIETLIIPLGALSFAIFWIAYQYYFLYVRGRLIDSGGQLHIRSLEQAFTGVYTDNLCLIGLTYLAKPHLSRVVVLPEIVILSTCFVLLLVAQWKIRALFANKLKYAGFTFSNSRFRPTGALPLRSPLSIWLPNDPFGISDNEISWLQSTYSTLSFTNNGAAVDEEGSLILAGLT